MKFDFWGKYNKKFSYIIIVVFVILVSWLALFYVCNDRQDRNCECSHSYIPLCKLVPTIVAPGSCGYFESDVREVLTSAKNVPGTTFIPTTNALQIIGGTRTYSIDHMWQWKEVDAEFRISFELAENINLGDNGKKMTIDENVCADIQASCSTECLCCLGLGKDPNMSGCN